MNDNDFSPRTQEIVSNIAQAVIVLVVGFAFYALQHPAPWSPLGEAQVTPSAPAPTTVGATGRSPVIARPREPRRPASTGSATSLHATGRSPASTHHRDAMTRAAPSHRFSPVSA